MAYTLLFRSRDRTTLKGRCLLGLMFGLAAVLAILTPTAVFPGVLIDSRSIFISMAGLLGGGYAALLASVIALVYRAVIGGPGASVGYAIILTAALLGMGAHYLISKKKIKINSVHLYLFGLIVHLDMVALLFALPEEIRGHVIETVALPVLLIYPIGTVLIGRRHRSRFAAEIDAVIFDVVMPRLGGKQALEEILKLRPGLPHLFASGYSENAVHINFIQKRGLHLLNKPYQAETLLRKIREVLDQT